MFARIRGGDGSGSFDWLVLGLGNPGRRYEHTRHNVGEDAVRLLAERLEANLRTGRNDAAVAETRIGDTRVVLAVPLTFMNESGRAAASLVKRFKFTDPERIIVVHDELDLEPGVVRVKAGGGLAGHNGLKSITSALSTQDYLRIRIGVGKPPSAARGADHVLSRIPAREREVLDVSVEIAADAVSSIVTRGAAETMQDINSR
ncbi:MAG: aminoacyl-tRNA hydrolase [Actinomycetota bacterium]|jgi:PTH1 family peptidyl-tRNA hydrolase|nr:aminoacyl-tRNA hydrolase [Actinomycetota bacterium]